MTTTCNMCQKKFLLKFILLEYNLTASDIAKEINVSASLVRKHIDGDRYCQMVDAYLIALCFGIQIGE